MTDTPPELKPEPSGSPSVHLSQEEAAALSQAGRAWSLVPRARVHAGDDLIDPCLGPSE